MLVRRQNLRWIERPWRIKPRTKLKGLYGQGLPVSRGWHQHQDHQRNPHHKWEGNVGGLGGRIAQDLQGPWKDGYGPVVSLGDLAWDHRKAGGRREVWSLGGSRKVVRTVRTSKETLSLTMRLVGPDLEDGLLWAGQHRIRNRKSEVPGDGLGQTASL